jgi:rare lipoprotein A
MRMTLNVEPAGRGLLRLAVLCAAATLAACTTPMFRPAPAPTAAQTSASPPPAAEAGQGAVRPHHHPAALASKIAHPPIDLSGQAEVGKASFYAGDLAGKKMANGHSFSPTENVAASKTLPLGTTAKVTDLDTGKSAIVKVEDRGPHVRGRVLDVSPKVAENLSMKKNGTAHVVVKPIAEPKSAQKPTQDEQAQP